MDESFKLQNDIKEKIKNDRQKLDLILAEETDDDSRLTRVHNIIRESSLSIFPKVNDLLCYGEIEGLIETMELIVEHQKIMNGISKTIHSSSLSDDKIDKILNLL